MIIYKSKCSFSDTDLGVCDTVLCRYSQTLNCIIKPMAIPGVLSPKGLKMNRFVIII